jgi:hypothetical protein
MAAAARTLSGSRFLRPQLSRFFNQVARVRLRISRFAKPTAAPLPPMPDISPSRFLTKPATPLAEAAPIPRTPDHSRFLPPKILSRFIRQVAQARPRIISRFLKGIAALMPPMPEIFSSRFFGRPRKPRSHLRPHWPPGKPQDPGR